MLDCRGAPIIARLKRYKFRLNLVNKYCVLVSSSVLNLLCRLSVIYCAVGAIIITLPSLVRVQAGTTLYMLPRTFRSSCFEYPISRSGLSLVQRNIFCYEDVTWLLRAGEPRICSFCPRLTTSGDGFLWPTQSRGVLSLRGGSSFFTYRVIKVTKNFKIFDKIDQ